ncbi:MAG: DMT family transporter [Gammaproteobacteria bacterium]|nr:DMT family transporter [Gammaproteobacteria bacterium]
MTPITAPARPLGSVYLRLVGVAALWGGTFIATRILAQIMPHLIAATARFAVAVALLLFVASRSGGLPRLTPRQMLSTFVLGFTGVFIYNVCFFGALALLPAGRTALIVALNPIVTALIMALILRERIAAVRWVGIAVALLGSAIVITRGDLGAALSESVGRGELLMFGGVCGWAVYTIMGQGMLRQLSPVVATTYASLWGGLLLGIGALFELRELQLAVLGWQTIGAMVYLGVFGTVVAFIWYYEGVQAIGPARTAIFNNLVPVFAVTFGAVLLGEAILPSMLIGGAMVIAGVMLTNRR